jgi:T5SS/PEP-CTERM-associated repeat protein/autotransporter-associated beta strand protein
VIGARKAVQRSAGEFGAEAAARGWAATVPRVSASRITLLLASASTAALLLLTETAPAQESIDNGNTVTVPGTYSSPWTIIGNLYIGNTGTGVLTIENGGTVSNTAGHVGFVAGSSGGVTVNGSGSQWVNSDFLTVGHYGTGALTIQNGGTVSNTFGYVGALSGSTGTATVGGSGSNWTNSNFLFVAYTGTGSLTIEDGGTVSNTYGYVGSASGSSGTVTVRGAGSQWTNSSELYIGENGTGALTIQNGGTVGNTDAHVGFAGGSLGTVTVNGSGSQWVNSGNLYVGENGTGALTIQNGGTVANTDGHLGFAGVVSSGTVTVSGPGSQWANRNLYVGNTGTGSLTIENGGTVSNTVGYVGFAAGSSGGVTLNGSGSQWANSDFLAIGWYGTGALTIQNGASVSNTFGYVGALFGSTGTATVGSGSLWTNGDILSIAYTGTGSLTIESGGAVTASTTRLADLSSGQAMLNINGTVAGRGMLTTAQIVKGAGSATLNFDGGILRATADQADFLAGFAPGNVMIGSGGAFVDSNGHSIGVAASLSGIGGLTKEGAGTLTLAGENTYASTTTINAGTLSVLGGLAIGDGGAVVLADVSGATLNIANSETVGSLSGGGTNGGNITLNANTLTTGGNNTNTNFGGVITGTGGLTKQGRGSFTLWGTNTYTGATTLEAGVLIVEGSIATSSLNTVNAGAVLTGTGAVGATAIADGGIFAPGNGSPGTSMTVASLALVSGAQYIVQINNATSSFAAVTGTATLGGATVSAVYANSSYVEKKYTILTAGMVSGTFNPTRVNTNLPSGFHSTVSYDATHAYLDLALSFVPPPGSGLGGNQQNVGNAIVNFFNTNGSIPIVFGGLTPAGITQVSGETATGSQQTTFNAMVLFTSLMTDPFIAARGDAISAGGSPTAFAEESLAYATARSKSEHDAYAAIYRKAPPPVAPSFEQPWSVWAAGLGGSQTTGGNAAVGSNNTSSGVYGAAVGADYRISHNTLAGFALAGGGTNFSIANGLGSGRSDLFQAGAFVRHTVGPAYISAALAYGWQDLTTDRTVTIAGVDQLRAKINANAFSGRVEGGYRFVTPSTGITPYAAGQFTTFDLPAYAERALSGTNTFALSYGAKSVTASRSELGVRTDKSWAMTDAIFTLRGRFAWAHDFNTDRNIAATFQTLPGASFVVNGAAQAHDTALTTASAEIKFISGLSLAATFEGEFSDVTRSYAGKGVVRHAW